VSDVCATDSKTRLNTWRSITCRFHLRSISCRLVTGFPRSSSPGVPSFPKDCSFVRPAESTQLRVAIACQIMFERFEWSAERGSCLRILILYLNIYRTSTRGATDS